MKTTAEVQPKTELRRLDPAPAGSKTPLFPAIATCTGQRFVAECLRLRYRIDEQLAPDLILGVQTGGGVILDTMLEHGGPWHPHGYVAASRDSSKLKKGHVACLLGCLPRSVANGIRTVEHLIREARFKVRRTTSQRHVRFSQEVADKVVQAKRICVIDDAVDTGSTLISIRDAIAVLNPQAETFYAALAQTFAQPLVKPNVVLFHHTLLRFPWAVDAGHEI